MSYLLFRHTSTFPFSLFNSLTLLFKKKFSLMTVSLPHLFIYLSLPLISWTPWPLHLLNNYLTFSSTSLSLSPLELPTSLSPQLIASPISYLNPMVRFFFSLPVLPMVLLLFESQRCVISLLVSLFVFCCCIHLGTLSCMSLWIKLYRAIVMSVVQPENITCHWEFSAYCAGLPLVQT